MVRQERDLTFDFFDGACNTFDESDNYSPRVVLCFDDEHDRMCHTFDGISYGKEDSTKWSHKRTLALGNYRGKPFTTGCYQSDDDCSFKTEILDLETRRWSDAPEYPFTGPDGSANDRK